MLSRLRFAIGTSLGSEYPERCPARRDGVEEDCRWCGQRHVCSGTLGGSSRLEPLHLVLLPSHRL